MAMKVTIAGLLAVLSVVSSIGDAAPISQTSPPSSNNDMQLGVILLTPEFKKIGEPPFYIQQEISEPLRRRTQRMARSVMDVENSEESSDDLETAAGTNLLRPLFVYRQQMAYRERNRKTGRRAAPTY